MLLQDELKTPFGSIRVLRNGQTMRYRIVDEPEKYAHDTGNYQLCFVVAWEPGETDEAWDLVDCLTC